MLKLFFVELINDQTIVIGSLLLKIQHR